MDANPHSNLHHVAFLRSDLAGASAAAVGLGAPPELMGRSGSSAPATLAYHRDPFGVRIEFVDEVQGHAIDRILTEMEDPHE